MPRITKKMIEEEKANEMFLAKATRECVSLVMTKMGLEVNKDGFIERVDDDNDEITILTFSGKQCVTTLLPNRETNMEVELPFDPYNNAKLAASLLTYYLSEYAYKEVLVMGPTNKKLNEEGKLIVKFTNGETLESHVYFKDSLKYIDAIYTLEGSAPPEFRALKGLDRE